MYRIAYFWVKSLISSAQQQCSGFTHMSLSIPRHNVTNLCAAFVTIDHNILLTRLSSWFGIQGSALDWFKSYLSSRSFWVKCNNNFSSCHTCICGALKVQSLVLYCLSCTPPLSVLLFRHFPWTTTFMLTTHNFSSLSIRRFWLQHDSASAFSQTDIFLDDCWSFNTQHFWNWISSCRSPTTCQN